MTSVKLRKRSDLADEKVVIPWVVFIGFGKFGFMASCNRYSRLPAAIESIH